MYLLNNHCKHSSDQRDSKTDYPPIRVVRCDQLVEIGAIVWTVAREEGKHIKLV